MYWNLIVAIWTNWLKKKNNCWRSGCEKVLEKGEGTIPKGIVICFYLTLFKEIGKNGTRRYRCVFVIAKGKQQKYL